MEKYSEKNNITIGDVADALGISKTTVSRAISGKGRIGEATRQRVLDYIRENNYKPNPMAKGLAKNDNQMTVLQLMTIFSNVGFMGIPVLRAATGDSANVAVFYAAVLNIFFNLSVLRFCL